MVMFIIGVCHSLALSTWLLSYCFIHLLCMDFTVSKKEGKPRLWGGMMHKKAHKQFAEDKQTKDMDYWNHVLWSDETKINIFGSDGVKRVWQQPAKLNRTKKVVASNSRIPRNELSLHEGQDLKRLMHFSTQHINKVNDRTFILHTSHADENRRYVITYKKGKKYIYKVITYPLFSSA